MAVTPVDLKNKARFQQQLGANNVPRTIGSHIWHIKVGIQISFENGRVAAG